MPAVTYIALSDESTPGLLRTVYVSPQIENVLGFTPEEWISDPELWDRQVHPDDREREHAESVRCIEEGRPFSMDYRMLTKDGRVMWVHDEDRVIRDEEGGVRSWQGVIVDITERKEAEQQNTEILESVTDGFVAWDSDWRYTYVNARAGEMFGRKPEDLVGKIYLEEFPEAEGTPFHRTYEQAMAERRTISFEDYYEPWDRWFENRVYPMADGGLAIYFTEITDRKRTERDIQESRARLERIVETVPDGIAIIDTKGNITFANSAAERILGLHRSKVTERRFDDPDWEITALDGGPLPAEDLPAARVLRTGKAVYGIEHAIRTPDGTTTMLSINAAPMFATNGDLSGVVASFTDITERKRAEEALREREHSLSESQRIAHIGSWVWDLTGPIEWTDETYRIYGVSPETFTPAVESLVDLVHPEDRPAMQRWIEACGAGQSPDDLEFRAILPDGTIRWLSGRGELTYDTENAPTYMAGTVQDITERKLAEEDARQNSALLQAVIEGTSDAVYVKDRHSRYLMLNEATIGVLGKSTEEVLGEVLGMSWDDIAALREQGVV